MAATRDSVTFYGLKRTERELKVLAKTLPVEVAKMRTEAAELIAREIAVRAPHGKTGELANSVRSHGTKSRASVTIGTGRTGLVPYAGVIVGGWPAHNIAPNRFPWEALDAKRPAAIALYELRMHELIERTMTAGGADV